ncbi:TetR/AcrR family transcriptional regulator [Dyella tabacisoli]|uniref:TetR/AcrR family transcriptional regulator n=1 Tax=Dyella tabacisoli TaxID=2282381 RepID=A0A369UWJ0_9GAMM|nr:TetR/AcrR family transcriptional regulator [Dyella tabacisoli]RDD82699.1 TetR/AcrR family transcriptional regulator [Dyella tabacisoli]
MRYAKGHKESTRERIVQAASRRFRQDGAEGVGVAALMAEAGLTHGGFYSHFDSKEALLRAAVEDSMTQTLDELTRLAKRYGDDVTALARGYLHHQHRDHPESGCAAAALAPELARHAPDTRAVFTVRLQALFKLIEARLPPTLPAAQRRERSMAIFAALMGSLQLARAVDDAALSERILQGGIHAATILALK